MKKQKQTCRVSKQLLHRLPNHEIQFECARLKNTSTEILMKSVFCEQFGTNEPYLLFDLAAPVDEKNIIKKSSLQHQAYKS